MHSNIFFASTDAITFFTLTLVLLLALAQCTWMKFSALAVRLTSLTVLEALLSAVIHTTHMQECDVKVWINDKMVYDAYICNL